MLGRKKQGEGQESVGNKQRRRLHPLKWFLGLGKGGKLLTVLILLAVGILSMRACSTIIKDEGGGEELVRVIETQQVALQPKDETLNYTGGLESEERAIVNAKNGGRVANILVENGTAVSPGQSLVLLESSDLKNMATINNATAQKAQAAYQNAKTNYERYKALFEAGGMSQKEFDDVRLGLIVAEADASSASAAAANAAEALANATIKAPIGGLVANKDVTLGQMLAPGQQIMTVESTGKVAVNIDIAQDDISKLEIGMPADVFIRSLGKEAFVGEVVSINPAADPATRAFAAKVVVDNKAGRLKPGMYSQVVIKTGRSQKVLAIPVRAVTGEDGLYFAFVVEGETVRRQRVYVGDVIGDKIEIKKGLEEGQIVATTGTSTLKDGDKIKVKE